MEAPSKTLLLHYRMQAILREHTFSGDDGFEYLGEDERGHKYRIGLHEVYVDQIEEFEAWDEEDE